MDGLSLIMYKENIKRHKKEELLHKKFCIYLPFILIKIRKINDL